MPDTHPAEIERWVRTHAPETITLVLTAHDRDAYLADMMAAGVTGFLAKSEPDKGLIAAIRRAAGGEILFDDAQRARVCRWRKEIGEKRESLTDRERQALKLLAQGLSNKTIAEKLGVMSKTAAYHITNILSKLGVASRQEVIAWAHTHLPADLEKIPE